MLQAYQKLLTAGIKSSLTLTTAVLLLFFVVHIYNGSLHIIHPRCVKFISYTDTYKHVIVIYVTTFGFKTYCALKLSVTITYPDSAIYKHKEIFSKCICNLRLSFNKLRLRFEV